MDESLTNDIEVPVEAVDVGDRVYSSLRTIKQFAIARPAEIACACMLFLMAANMLAGISRKSITNDEIVHIPAGYYHLVVGNYQLNNEHPPLAKMWSAIPLLFIQPIESKRTAEELQSNYSEVTWGFHERFWSENRNQFDLISFWTRFMMIIGTVGLGVLIFMFARELFGAVVAVLAVAMFSLEPTVLAHGRIVHTDIPAQFVYLLFFLALLRYFKTRTMRSALWLGLISGIALITKFSMIVLFPILTCLVVGGLVFAPRFDLNRKKVLLHAGVTLTLVLLVINAAYRFERPQILPGDVKWVQARSPESFDNWMTFFRVGSKVLPTYYLFGQYNVLVHNRDGHSTSLLGQYNDKGWWYYFPMAFALKTSLPFLILTIAGLAWALTQLIRRRDQRYLWLLVPVVIYAALAMSSHINIGVRHFLPEYSFFFIAAAVLVDALLRMKYSRHRGLPLVLIMFAWMTVETARAYPHYVPYMNQLASGHPKWWYLSDSNVEWGDDARKLADYLHARGETEVTGAMMGAWGTLAQYGIKYNEIFPRPGYQIPETKYVAIGASFLNGSTNSILPDENGKSLTNEQRVNYLAAYRNLQPEIIIGDAVYVFRVK